MAVRVGYLPVVVVSILLAACGSEVQLSLGEIAAEATGSGLTRDASALPSWHPPVDIDPHGLPDGHPPLPMGHPECPAAAFGDEPLPWVEGDGAAGDATGLIST